jgi:hypothetical protein
MWFDCTEVDENFPLARFISEPLGRWEWGLVPMLFGTRIRVGLVGDGGPTLDYCCGSNRDEWFLFLGLISGHMMWLPEEITPQELLAIFPVQHKRPLDQDPVCREKLLALGSILERMYGRIQAKP